jgi:hypothetical protein
MRTVKSRPLGGERHAARLREMRDAYEILVGKPKGNGDDGKPKRTWENIETDRMETECDGVDCIYLTQRRLQWRAFVNTVMNLRVP